MEVMIGDDNGNFGPNDPVNRSQMAVVMAKLLNLDSGRNAEPNYYHGSLWSLTFLQQNSTFCPKISRFFNFLDPSTEMAVVMANLLKLDYKYYEASCDFWDVPTWARPYVGACYANKIRGFSTFWTCHRRVTPLASLSERSGRSSPGTGQKVS